MVLTIYFGYNGFNHSFLLSMSPHSEANQLEEVMNLDRFVNPTKTITGVPTKYACGPKQCMYVLN